MFNEIMRHRKKNECWRHGDAIRIKRAENMLIHACEFKVGMLLRAGSEIATSQGCQNFFLFFDRFLQLLQEILAEDKEFQNPHLIQFHIMVVIYFNICNEALRLQKI